MGLTERFGKENAPQAYDLRRKVTTIHQDDLTVSTYYTNLRSIWDEVQSVSPTPTCTRNGCSCDVTKEFLKIREKERLYDFLMGLKEEYNAVKTQILSTNPSPNLGVTYHLVSQDEQQRQVAMAHSYGNDTKTFQVSGKPNNKAFGKGNSQSSNNKRKNDDRWCKHC
ncbi:hypothetical protein Lser_V15G33019 [Lactuca serriola]